MDAMTPQLCNFNQSKALKALGYSWECLEYFMGSGRWFDTNFPENHNREMGKEKYSRPTIQDAIRFFRVEKGCHGHVFPVFSGTLKWGYGVVDIVEFSAKKWDEPPYFSKYDDAENALLNRLIEISNQEKA